MAVKQALPTTPNNANAHYLQPIFNDELPLSIGKPAADAISEIVGNAIVGNYRLVFFKRYVIEKLSKLGFNPMWVCVNESPNGAHVIFELDINGIGTGVYLQILNSSGIYNLFRLHKR